MLLGLSDLEEEIPVLSNIVLEDLTSLKSLDFFIRTSLLLYYEFKEFIKIDD